MLLLLFAWLGFAATTLWTIAGLIAVIAVTRRHRGGAVGNLHDTQSPVDRVEALPAVSVLKPLCGRDADLAKNLESFFLQDHPDLELVFGVMDHNDPALEVVREMARRYPHVPCQIVVHPGGGALNPKVDNLLGLLPRARNDLVLVSDSNVRAPHHYVRELATLYARERPGLVTNLFAGGGEDSLGGALESVELAGFCAAGIALPTWLGDALLVGKSALFSRGSFDKLGGFRRLANVLAEDFVMGKIFARAGERVLIAPTVLVNVTRSMTVRTALARHLRWSMLRFRLRPVAAALEPFTSPLALLPLGWLLFGPWALLWALLLIAVRDAGGWLVLRGADRLWLPLLLGPLRDLAALAVWIVAPLKQHVSWRGHRYRLGAGTLLYPARR
jgi:ceramide glucosyltransferase